MGGIDKPLCRICGKELEDIKPLDKYKSNVHDECYWLEMRKAYGKIKSNAVGRSDK